MKGNKPKAFIAAKGQPLKRRSKTLLENSDLAALRAAIDEGDSSGIAVGNPFGVLGKNPRREKTPGTFTNTLLLHPRRPTLMFAAGARENPRAWRTTHDADSTVARSRDGGKNWEFLDRALPGHLRGNIEAMAMEVCDSSCAIFAATTAISGRRLLKVCPLCP
jgi:hypothetical protein